MYLKIMNVSDDTEEWRMQDKLRQENEHAPTHSSLLLTVDTMWPAL